MKRKLSIILALMLIMSLLTVSCSSPPEVAYLKCGSREFGEWTYYYTVDLDSDEVTEYSCTDYADRIISPRVVSAKTMSASELEQFRRQIGEARLDTWGKVSYWYDDYLPKGVEMSIDGGWCIEVSFSDGSEKSFEGSEIVPEKGDEFIAALETAGINGWNWV